MGQQLMKGEIFCIQMCVYAAAEASVNGIRISALSPNIHINIFTKTSQKREENKEHT